jgi:fatty acid desaturase
MATARDTDRAYATLRRSVTNAGLLERDYTYYLWRSGVSFAILAAGIAIAFSQPAWAPALPFTALIIAFGSVQVGLIGHDAGHLAVFGSRRMNLLLGWLCWSLSLGISFWYWNDRHNRHHAATNDITADPDLRWSSVLAYSAVMVSARQRRPNWLTRYQTIVGPLYTLLLPFAFRVEGWTFTLRELRGTRRGADLTLVLVSALAWLWPISVLGWWWIALFIVSQIVAGLYLGLAIAPNHIAMPNWPGGAHLTFLERQVLSSRNVTPNPFCDFLFGGLNYQIEHHLFPTMPRSHFAKARALVKPFCAARGLTYTETDALAGYRMVLGELQRAGRPATST